MEAAFARAVSLRIALRVFLGISDCADTFTKPHDHTPAAMAQLTIQPNQTASLCFAAQEYRWELPQLDSQWLWLAALPDTAGNGAVLLWQLLTDW